MMKYIRWCAVLLVAATLTACDGALRLAPAPNLFIDDATNPFEQVPPALRGADAQLLFATDRLPDHAPDQPLRYGVGRSVSLAFGMCTVRFGQDVPWERLVADSRGGRRQQEHRLQVEAICPAGDFPAAVPMARTPTGWVEDLPSKRQEQSAARELQALLGKRLALTPRKEVFLFVHGFSNTFDEAASRTAQIWHYIGRQGVPVVYTWPAGFGGLRGYMRDRESGEFTVFHLKQFIRALSQSPDLKRIHIVAHSRGTDVLMTALRELNIESLAMGTPTHQHFKIGNVVLAAPDLDFEVSTQRLGAERIGLAADRFTFYISPNDRAIGLSEWLFGGMRRIGRMLAMDLSEQQRANLRASGAQVIDVETKSLDFIGHSYFIDNPAVLSDLILLLRDNREPGAEHGRPLIRDASGFWQLRDGYPRATKPPVPTP